MNFEDVGEDGSRVQLRMDGYWIRVIQRSGAHETTVAVPIKLFLRFANHIARELLE